MLRENVKTHAFLAPEEAQALVKHLSYDKAQKRTLFGILTGLRPKELTYLAWPDIDFNMKTLTVTSKPPEFVIKTQEQRVIPLDDTAIEILRSVERDHDRWVFTHEGQPIKNMRRALDTAAKAAGIKKKVTPNMLRHTFATLSLIGGADVMTVKAMMGHHDLATTARYLHAIDGEKRKAASIVSGFFSASPQRQKKRAPEGALSH